MGNLKHIGLRAPDREKLVSLGWLHGQLQAFRDAILDECMAIDLEQSESAMHLGERSGGLYGLVDGWLDVLISRRSGKAGAHRMDIEQRAEGEGSRLVSMG